MTSLRSRLSILVASSSVLLALVAGCSAASAERADDVATDEAALEACGADKYAEALAHYKNAVAWSKERLAAGGVACETEHGYLWSIADEASRAVMTCGAFRETIKSSPWAEPLRQALAESLTLRSLTGELLVIKDSEWQNWTGTETLFEKGDLTFWARSEGVLGPKTTIVFHPDGTTTSFSVGWEDDTVKTVETQGTYSISKVDGTEKGKRRITVTSGDETTSFILGVEEGWEYKSAPIFTLTPEGLPEDVADGYVDDQKLYSLVDECSA